MEGEARQGWLMMSGVGAVGFAIAIIVFCPRAYFVQKGLAVIRCMEKRAAR
jgi:hypothetical protein